MKKTMLLCLMLFGLIAFCCSIPAFIQNNRIELTPEQKATYKQKVRERPDSLSFNPLQVGNKWWFRFDGESNYVFIGREVVDSMMVNNHVYYRVTGFGAGNDYWIRNDGDRTMILDSLDIDNDLNTLELVNEDFTIINEALVYHDLSSFGSNAWQCHLMYQDYLNIFGVQTCLRSFHYYYPEDHNSLSANEWARGLGLIGFELLDSVVPTYYYCVLCRINNLLYGDTTVLNNDSAIDANISITCYPNPFRDGINIKFLNKEHKTHYDVSIFDVKGRKVYNHNNILSDSFTWNPQKDCKQKLSSGIYFFMITENNKVIHTSKVIYLK